MPSPDPVKVRLAALITIERNGARALEIAEKVLLKARNPDFAMAVIKEIKRLQEPTVH